MTGTGEALIVGAFASAALMTALVLRWWPVRLWWVPGTANAASAALLVLLHRSLAAKAIAMVALAVAVGALLLAPSRPAELVPETAGRRAAPPKDRRRFLREALAVAAVPLQFFALAGGET
jgi:hypothetical protein